MSELVTYTAPSAEEWGQNKELAKIVSGTEFVPKAMRGKPEAVLACVLTGREVGVGPMQALKHIALIEGKAGMSAELMSALVRRAGHKIRVLERSNTRVVVEGVRSDDPQHPETVAWSIEDAQRAGLASKDVWKRYPQAMLWSRATSQLCRSLFADVLAGVSYTPEELDGITEPTTEVTVGEPIANVETGEVVDWEQQLAADTMPKPSTKTPEGGEGSDMGQSAQAQEDSSGHTPSGNIVTDWLFDKGIRPANAASFLRKKDANKWGRFTDKNLAELNPEQQEGILELLIEEFDKQEPAGE